MRVKYTRLWALTVQEKVLYLTYWPVEMATISPKAVSRLWVKDLLEMSVEERAWAGVFLAFQYPVEVPGVSNIYLLKAAFKRHS